MLQLGAGRGVDEGGFSVCDSSRGVDFGVDLVHILRFSLRHKSFRE